MGIRFLGVSTLALAPVFAHAFTVDELLASRLTTDEALQLMRSDDK